MAQICKKCNTRLLCTRDRAIHYRICGPIIENNICPMCDFSYISIDNPISPFLFCSNEHVFEYYSIKKQMNKKFNEILIDTMNKKKLMLQELLAKKDIKK